MKAKTYPEYLKSRLWRHIRRNVLRRDKWKCQSCGGRASEVHHLRYDKATMEGRDLSGLVSICRVCHDTVSYDLWGFKRTASEQREWTR